MTDENTSSRTGGVENISASAEPPPVAMLLPLLQLVLAGSSLLLRLGIHLLFSVVYPLRIIWTITHALLSPFTVTVKIALDIVLLTPYSIISMVAIALYPVYVFCAVACIVGAAVGYFGHYVATSILSVLARSKYFIRPPSPSPVATPSGPQAMLRRRKRKSVRLQ